MGKKRANQPGYKPAKDSLGRMTWVPEDVSSGKKSDAIRKMGPPSEVEDCDAKMNHGGSVKTMEEILALADHHAEQRAMLVNTLFDGASFSSMEDGAPMNADEVYEYIKQPDSFENDSDDIEIDFDYLSGENAGEIISVCRWYGIDHDGFSVSASEFFTAMIDDPDIVDELNKRFS